MRQRLCSARVLAFTLIELLVVVAIIALLIAILLPALRCAREQGRASKCGAQLRGIGAGLSIYVSEQRDWIPGVNTSGAALELARLVSGNNAAALRDPRLPVQTSDWLSPALAGQGGLEGNRAQRYQMLLARYGCTSVAGRATPEFFPYGLPGGEVADRADFTALGDVPGPVSYLMPGAFQLWGSAALGQTVASSGTFTVFAKTVPDSWPVETLDFRSQARRLGDSARKVAAADGTRFFDAAGTLLTDVAAIPSDSLGSFAGSGAWWGASDEYGVAAGSSNWDGGQVSTGNSLSAGENLALSYRHGCSAGAAAAAARDNNGLLNALFFDGHVASLGDRSSRDIDLWYPRGSLVRSAAATQGLTAPPPQNQVP